MTGDDEIWNLSICFQITIFFLYLVGKTDWRNRTTFQGDFLDGWFSRRNGQQHLPKSSDFLSRNWKRQTRAQECHEKSKSSKKKENFISDIWFYCTSDYYSYHCNQLKVQLYSRVGNKRSNKRNPTLIDFWTFLSWLYS